MLAPLYVMYLIMYAASIPLLGAEDYLSRNKVHAYLQTGPIKDLRSFLAVAANNSPSPEVRARSLELLRFTPRVAIEPSEIAQAQRKAMLKELDYHYGQLYPCIDALIYNTSTLVYDWNSPLNRQLVQPYAMDTLDTSKYNWRVYPNCGSLREATRQMFCDMAQAGVPIFTLDAVAYGMYYRDSFYFTKNKITWVCPVWWPHSLLPNPPKVEIPQQMPVRFQKY